MCEPVEKKRSVRETSERVVEGPVVELFFEHTTVAYVASVEHDSVNLLVRQQAARLAASVRAPQPVMSGALLIGLGLVLVALLLALSSD